MSEQLGLTECVSIALGGMIGGGIYAVLGVVAGVTGAATWAAFVLAGAVALCAGYSYNKLNVAVADGGGSVSFVQSLLGNSTLAGMLGWTLLFGYVGSMAMYAFAFAEFAVGFSVVPATVFALPVRPVVSVAAVAAFVALNLLGARTTGTAENVLVAAKVLVLVAFGVFGLVYATSLSDTQLSYGFGQLTTVGPVVAAAISFVAFQGWQLLFYDQESVENHVETIRTAVYVAIPAAVAVYVLVAVVTVNLAPEALEQHPHVALAEAASAMLSVVGLSGLGFVVISLSALFSTGSAINATLFSAAHFAKRLIQGDLLPDRFGDTETEGVPEKTVLALGAVNAAFAVYGSLGAITSFASLSFIVVFGAMSLLAFRQRNAVDADVHPVPPAVGAVGALGFAPLMLWNLYTREPETFWMVVVLAVLTLGAELLYFERDVIQHELGEFEDGIESRL
ncbi:APC family permease [Halobacterium sp. CBA1126]|uniref:APC family permease n=1 Tax=Halobacterium sp. CBA1126 TaxID=2668074 RepID=UPI0012FA1ABA|nr:APC family permease [Halobacterium sp. CBA1126]MUV60549.1 amino acid permease [Halobacterium sp. CBA1126]